MHFVNNAFDSTIFFFKDPISEENTAFGNFFLKRPIFFKVV